MREKEPRVVPCGAVEYRPFLVDEELWIAVVPHGDWQMHPRAPRYEIRHEGDRAARGSLDTREHEPWGVPLGEGERVPLPESRALRSVDELQSAGRAQQVGKPSDERRFVARVRRPRPLPGAPAHHDAGPRAGQAQRRPLLVGRENTANVVEVEVGQHDDVDVLGADPARPQGCDEDVLLWLHAIASAQTWLQERADSSLDEDVSAARFA